MSVVPQQVVIGWLLMCLAVLSQPVAAMEQSSGGQDWWQVNDVGNYELNLYFAYTHTCPHCQAAQPFIAEMAARHPWLNVKHLPLDDGAGYGRSFSQLAKAAGGGVHSVPAFVFCGQMQTGFDDAQGMGRRLEAELLACYEHLQTNPEVPLEKSSDALTYVPGLGEQDFTNTSLGFITVTLALLDSVNPCAFFVLLVLLSMLVNAKSRVRMLMVGGVFVSFSGLIYFLFMSAWLNLFMAVGQIGWMTLLAGGVALIVGVLNTRSFFAPETSASLSIPASAKPKLFNRMRNLVGAQSFPAMLAGTVMLAILANSYELLCTAGLPMVFTRILTLRELSSSQYYAYLGLYCLIYIIPLLVIVVGFAWTLGRRKLSAEEGQFLKLLSGLMMSALGLVLLVVPQWLSQVGTSIGILVLVMACAVLLARWRRRTG